MTRAPRKAPPLEALVPGERLEDAVATLVRAALGRRARDLATTRSGGLGFLALRLLPRRLVDRGMRRQLQRAARDGRLSDSGLGSEMHERLVG